MLFIRVIVLHCITSMSSFYFSGHLIYTPHSPLMMDGGKRAYSSKPFGTTARAGVSVYIVGDTPSNRSFITQEAGVCVAACMS